MANNDNIIYAKFNHGHEITTDPRSQYAYGQVVKISGLHLPASFDADIANKGDKQAKAVIGTNNELPIDDNYFLSGKDIIVMINVHATDKDGRTKYIINIPINKRFKRADIELEPVEQDVVSTAIATLNEAVERTSADVESAENSATQAKESATIAKESAISASNSETLTEQYMERAETAANLAEQKATEASMSADTATAKAKEADTSATNAENSALNAQDSALTAQGYMDSASNFANQAEISATKAKSSADDAELSKDHAEKMAMDAEKSEQHVEQISDEFDTRVEQAIDNVSTMGQELAEKAEAWAVGERNGKPIKQDDPAYNNNAKYWAVQAHTDSESASSDAQSASASATSASESAYEASKSADRAEQAAESIDFGLDATPTQGSTNAVQSGGVYDAIPSIDPTLTKSGQAADAKVTGDKITGLKEDIIQTAGVVEEMECGLTDEVKTALLACFTRVAWIGDDGQTYYDALSDALNRSRVISSISAVFTQGSVTIYDTDELYALKQYLAVTATYSDGTTKEVNNYTLSGKLVAGTSTITVAYNKKTTTFKVTVTHQAKILDSITAIFNSSASITTDNVLDDLRPYLTVLATYADSTTSTITNYSLSGNLNVGTNTITVSYGGKTTTFTVNVTQAEATLQSISATFNQGSVVIYENSSLESLKPYLTVTARYSNGTTQTVTNYTLSGTLRTGTSTITASYGGKTTTFNVTVSEHPTLKSITATFTQGSAVIYTDSSLNDLKPYLVVTAKYSDSTTQTVTNYTLSGTLTKGTSTITVSYGGKTATFNVTVSERVTPPTPSEPIYTVTPGTVFNGTSDYIDTGLQLMGSDKSNYTIVFDVLDKSSPVSNKNNTLFHCMHEGSPWPGNCIQFLGAGSNKSLNFDMNSNTTKSRVGAYSIPKSTSGVREKFVGIIDFQSGTIKMIANIAGVDYVESNTLPSDISSTVVTETALIGCYQDLTGTKGRFWTGTIYDFKIYNYAWSETEANAYLQEDHS